MNLPLRSVCRPRTLATVLASVAVPALARAQDVGADVAQSGAGELAQGPAGLGPLVAFVPYLAMGLVVYLLLLRPASRQRKEHQDMLASLKRGDEIVTQSGIIGRINALETDVVVLEVADKVKVRMLRDRITGLFGGKAPATPARGD